MKEFIEGVFMCIGIGMFYLSVSAMEHGATGWALAMFGCGVVFLMLMIALVCEPKQRR